MKNQFQRPMLYDHEIVDEDEHKIGEIRVTPTSVKWKRKGQQIYKSVTLEQFTAWIESSESGAKATKK